jgi:hypothetical protein
VQGCYKLRSTGVPGRFPAALYRDYRWYRFNRLVRAASAAIWSMGPQDAPQSEKDLVLEDKTVKRVVQSKANEPITWAYVDLIPLRTYDFTAVES